MILSTLPGATYGWDSGTSMAAPYVTGVAALLAAADPSRDWRAIRNLLMTGGDTVPALSNTITGKRLDAYGALACSNSTVASRLQPMALNNTGAVGSPVTLAYLNINCAQPNGSVSVQPPSGGEAISLEDNGIGADQAAGDGIYSGQWTPPALGSYTLTFPGSDNVNVQVLNTYVANPVSPADYHYQTISGTNLNLGDDSVATITSPFSIEFGGGSFNNLYVSSNGTISFTDMFGSFVNVGLPTSYELPQNVMTLVAPFWEDLYPVSGSDNNVFWAVTGSAPNRGLVVEWRNVESFACPGDSSAAVTFQVVFQEGSSNVLFNYANAVFGGNCRDEDYGETATVGIQIDPNTATTWENDAGGIGSGTGILWTLTNGTPPANPVPTITSISPSSVQVGGGDFNLTVTGTNFTSLSRVGSEFDFHFHFCVTTYVSSTELQAIIPGGDIANLGTDAINVINPSPGGGTSNLVTIAINGPPTPTITALNPSSTTAGGFSFRLEVDGSGFDYKSLIQWNGTPVQTVYYTPNMMVGLITADMIASPGTALVSVTNAPSNGNTSKTITFTISAATASSQTPSSGNVPVRNPMGNTTISHIPGVIPSPKYPPRFLGWNMLGKEGPDYVKHFLRAHVGLEYTRW